MVWPLTIWIFDFQCASRSHSSTWFLDLIFHVFGVFERILADRFYESPGSLDSSLKVSRLWRNGYRLILILMPGEQCSSERVKSGKRAFQPFTEDLRFYRGLRLRTLYLRPEDLELRPRLRHGHWLFWIRISDESLKLSVMVISWSGFSHIKRFAVVVHEQCLTCDGSFEEERLRGA